MTKENISNTSNFKIPLFRLSKIPYTTSIRKFLKMYDGMINAELKYEYVGKFRESLLHVIGKTKYLVVEEFVTLELDIIKKAEVELKHTEVLDYKFRNQKAAELAYSMDEETLARYYDGKFSVFRLTDKDGNICDPLTYVILIKEGKLYYGIL